MKPADIAVAVLAGGSGSRIGGEKPLVQLAGATLVERAIGRARQWDKAAVVVVRSVAQLGGLELPAVPDAPGIEGPLAGLAAGLHWAQRHNAKVLLTLPCDMPFLPEDLASRLGQEIGANGAAIASSGGMLHPVCGLWRVDAIDQLPSYCATGQRSLRGLAQHIGFTEVAWSTGPRDPFFNINSPAELEMAKQMLRN